MALRRLFSGWLIAVAALARSMAQVLERAAADRSEPTPDPVPGPVMAALAERYPGAPDHWLTLVAQRTAQLADAGEAPLSLTSQASAWPPSLPGAAGPLAPLMPTVPDGAEAVTREPSRPVARASDATASFQSDAVPSLAALQGRSSEVWRRPVAGQGRRPRPVFAPVEPPARVSPVLESAPPISPRPRPRLKLDERAPPNSPVDRPPLFPSSEETTHDKTTSEVTRIEPEAPVERPFATAFAAPPLSGAVMDLEEANRLAPTHHADAPVAMRSASRPWFGATSAGPPSVRDPSAFAPEQWVEAASPETSLSKERPTVLEAPATDRPNASSHAERPTARRSVFKALAGLVAKPAAAPIFHRQTSTRLASSMADAALVDSPGSDQGPRSPRPPSDAPQSRWAVEPERPALKADAPHARAEPRLRFISAPRRSDRIRTSSVTAEEFANDEAPRVSFAISHPSKSRAETPRATGSSPDDRWPRFPPSVFTPPLVAEIPSPRLDQLAREQEEGRWSV